jgi:hypothetical protein
MSGSNCGMVLVNTDTLQEQQLLYCHFVRRETHIDEPGIEGGPP